MEIGGAISGIEDRKEDLRSEKANLQRILLERSLARSDSRREGQAASDRWHLGV